MQLARALLSHQGQEPPKSTTMPKKTTKKTAKKAAKKTTTKKVAKKVTKKVAKKAPAKKAAKKTIKKAAKKTAKKTTRKTTKASTTKDASSPKQLSEDDIRQAAYFNYISRVENGIYGDAQGDWLAAAAALQVA